MGRVRRLAPAPAVALVFVILTLVIIAPFTALLAAVMVRVQATAIVLPGCFVASLAFVYRHPKEGDTRNL
jgi:hypothetical protein